MAESPGALTQTDSPNSTRLFTNGSSISVRKTSSTFRKTSNSDVYVPLKRREISICVAISLLLPVSIGGTTVALLAYSIHIVGLALSLLLMAAAVIINWFSCYLLLQSGRLVQADSFHDIALRTYGKGAEILVAALNSISLIASGISATVFIKNVARALVEHVWQNPPAILLNTYFWVFLFIGTGVIPFLACPRIAGMRLLAYITTGIILLFTFVSMAGLFVLGLHDPEDISWFKPDPSAMIISLTVYNYPLMIQVSIQPVFKQLKNYTISRGLKVVLIDCLFIIGLFAVIGIFGYLTFLNNRIDELEQFQNIFRTPSYSQWVPMKFISFTLIFTTLTSIVALLFPPKQIVYQFLSRCLKLEPSRERMCLHFGSGLIVSAVVVVFALLANDIVVVMRFNGVALYPIISYAFPALFYLRVKKRNPRSCGVVMRSVLAGLMLFLTVATLFKGLYDLFFV